jgi:purine-binding chemotaxis protein CheW
VSDAVPSPSGEGDQGPPEALDSPGESAPGAACALVQRIVVFRLGDQYYAFPLQCVREIQQIVAFSEVPTSGGVVGMVNLRGQVIPALDVRRLVGIAARDYRLETPMVIAEVDGRKMALIVDEVQDVIEVPPEGLQEAPALHRLSAVMLGVARVDDRLAYVLDIDRLVAADPRGSARP